jgi:hypothetical protein
MAETVTGIFEGVEKKSAKDLGKTGKWTLYTALVSGKKYGLGFDGKLVEDMPTGQPVKVQIEKNDKGYWQLISIEKIDELPVSPQTPVSAAVGHSTGSNTGGVDYSQVDRREALKVACEVVNATFNSPHAKKNLNDAGRVNRIVAWADHFVKYIQTGSIDPVNADLVKKLEEAYKE